MSAVMETAASGSQPRIEVAAGVAYHSYNHYGQMVVYARIRGVVPPASRREALTTPASCQPAES